MIRCLLVMAMIILTPPKGNGGMPIAPKPAVVEARVWDKLAAALSFVESRNDDRAYNATSGALGRWQMKKVYVDEVNKMANQMVYLMDNYPDFVQIGRWWISKKHVMSWTPKGGDRGRIGLGYILHPVLWFG